MFSMVTSPPVAAAATIKVPASIRSGITGNESPFKGINTRNLDHICTGSLLGPYGIKEIRKSTISGSLAAFSINVWPLASKRHHNIFSGPTLGKSR